METKQYITAIEILMNEYPLIAFKTIKDKNGYVGYFFFDKNTIYIKKTTFNNKLSFIIGNKKFKLLSIGYNDLIPIVRTIINSNSLEQPK